MKEVKVLGSGCRNCETTAKLIEAVAAEKGVAIRLEKVTDMAAIVRQGVMSTPGVVVDGKVVHSGGVPERKKVEAWLSGASAVSAIAVESGGCCSGGNCA